MMEGVPAGIVAALAANRRTGRCRGMSARRGHKYLNQTQENDFPERRSFVEMQQIAVFHRAEGTTALQERRKLMSNPYWSLQNPYSHQSERGLRPSPSRSRVKSIPSLMIGTSVIFIWCRLACFSNLGPTWKDVFSGRSWTIFQK